MEPARDHPVDRSPLKQEYTLDVLKRMDLSLAQLLESG